MPYILVFLREYKWPVDFEKTLEYWQQDKWNGSSSAKWYIVKDVPNCILKHTILGNNENKTFMNSRDTQEMSIIQTFKFTSLKKAGVLFFISFSLSIIQIHLERGLQMFKIFKEHVSKTSILDDFTSYESHQKLMQDKRAKQQQIQKKVDCLRSGTTSEQQQEVANGKPKPSALCTVPNGVHA